MDNPNPQVFERRERRTKTRKEGVLLYSEDVFDAIRDIQDPEHPYSLEQLNVVREELILVDHERKLCQYVPFECMQCTSFRVIINLRIHGCE